MGQRLLYFQYRRFHAVCQGQGRAFLLPFQLELQGLDDALFKAGNVTLADAQGVGGFLLGAFHAVGQAEAQLHDPALPGRKAAHGAAQTGAP